MTGGGGDDLLYGEAGWDWIAGGSGNDGIKGGTGDDQLLGERGTDSIDGGDGNDVIQGGEGADKLAGGGGDDEIYGNYGDEVDGGEGGTDNDTLYLYDVDYIDYKSAESGIVHFNDASTLDFFNIETVTILSSDGIVSGTSGDDDIDIFYHDADGDWVDGWDALGAHGVTGDGDYIDAGAGNDKIWAAQGDDIVYAGSGDDYIESWDGNDLLYGEEGNDYFIIGWEQQTAFGGDDADTFEAYATQIVDGGAGGVDDDTLIASDVDHIELTGVDRNDNGWDGIIHLTSGDTITFSEIENFTLDGASWTPSNTVEGTTGDDVMNPGYADADGDEIDGIDGNDDLIFAGAGNDTINAGDGSDTVYGGDGNDTYASVSGDGVDTVYLEGGDDTFTMVGGGGNDTADGGEADETLGDTYIVTSTGDTTTTTLTGDGTGTVALGTDVRSVENFEIFDFQADTVDDFDGTADTEGLTVYAHGGDDTIATGSGNDTIDGGTGDDAMDGGNGDDTFVLTDGFGNNTITGGELGETTGDHLDASALTTDTTLDLTPGGSKPDPESGTLSDGTNTATFSEIERVSLGSGDDTLHGSSGSDEVDGGAGSDILHGDDGNDTLHGGDGWDDLLGDMGNDVLYGDGGSDSIDGSDGDDILYGGDGNDILIGDIGNDTLTGGAGNDTIVFADGDGNDTVTDFDFTDTDTDGFTNDQIDVSNLTDAAGNPVNISNVTVTDTNGDGSGDAILQFPNGESITLTGVDPATLDTSTLHSMGIPCFAAGTLIDTLSGARTVENLVPGDLVFTVGGAPQPVLWTGQCCLDKVALKANPRLRPVMIRKGRLGNSRDLYLSPQHRVALGPRSSPTGFVPARWLAEDGDGQFRIAKGCKEITYVHILLARHAVVRAEGTPVESFYPGPQGLQALDAWTRARLFWHNPALSKIASRDDAQALYGPLALPEIRRADMAAPLEAATDSRGADVPTPGRAAG